MTIFAQIPSLPIDPFFNLVKVGEFGSAVAMLILGFYLHWQASKAPLPDIPARKGVANQFMLFAGAFFLLCCAVELVKLCMPDQHPKIHAMVEVPPLDDTNYEELGKIEIVGVDSSDETKDTRPASLVPQIFFIHENSTFIINLNNLVNKFKDLKIKKQLVDNNLSSETRDFGPEGPK